MVEGWNSDGTVDLPPENPFFQAIWDLPPENPFFQAIYEK